MNDTTPLQRRIEAIVARGHQIRERVAAAVSQAATEVRSGMDDLGKLSREVIEAARRGAASAVPADRESILRQAVDGLADGLGAFANATRLTLEEARASGKRFAQEDLRRAVADLDSAARLTGNAVAEVFETVETEFATQGRRLASHARRAFAQAEPSLRGAASAAREDLARLGREAFAAGSSATKQALGTLFAELGRRLERAGEHLRHRPGAE